MYEAFSIHLDDILLYLCPFRVSYLLLVFRTKSTKCVYFHENPPVGRRNQYKRQSRGYCPRSDSWSVRIYITNTRPLSREAKHMTLRIHMYVDTLTNHASEIVWDYRCNGPNKLNTLQESTSHICPWIIHAFAAPSHSLRRIRNYSNRRCALRGPVYSYGTNKTIHCSELSFMAACI